MSVSLRPGLSVPVITFLLILLSGCGNEAIETRQSFVFGTLVEIKIRTADREQARTAADDLLGSFDRLHKSWHAWKPGDMTQTSASLSQGDWFEPPAGILPVLELSRQMFDASHGLFNPAMGNLVALWGFHDDDLPGTPPAKNRIDNLVATLPGMDDIEFNKGKVRSHHADILIDAGGLAKGLAVDMGIDLLRERGIKDALVNAGGDLCGIGSRGDRAWRVGIRHPDRKGVLASIDLMDNECVFTSGTYERAFSYQGINYHHIIDPRTGYPASAAVSVTVLHEDGALADAASTALLIAGPDQWQTTAAAMGVDKVLLVDNAGRLKMTPGMRDRITIMSPHHKEIIVTDQ